MEPLLVCPGCRKLVGDVLDVHTLEPAGDVLACSSCARRYPIIDGVPIILADPRHYARSEIGAILERDLSVEVAGLLVEFGADDAPYARLLEHVSIYMDAHWGDRADPPDGFACGAILEKLAALEKVETAVELGCSAGRVCAELSQRATHVVGVDLNFATLRRARHVLAGDRVTYGRRIVGRHYSPVSLVAPATDRVRLICSDALDPPLVPGTFDRVVALNLLDAVQHPETLLNVVTKLCAPGGEVILTSPYTWQSGAVVDDERIGRRDPATATVTWLTEKGFSISDQADLSWTLRRDDRSSVSYRTHYLRVRKPAGS